MKMIKTVDNKITKYTDVDKMQQIYLTDSGEIEFVSTDYENKQVPLEDIYNLYDSLMSDIAKYNSQFILCAVCVIWAIVRIVKSVIA